MELINSHYYINYQNIIKIVLLFIIIYYIILLNNPILFHNVEDIIYYNIFITPTTINGSYYIHTMQSVKHIMIKVVNSSLKHGKVSAINVEKHAQFPENQILRLNQTLNGYLILEGVKCISATTSNNQNIHRISYSQSKHQPIVVYSRTIASNIIIINYHSSILIFTFNPRIISTLILTFNSLCIP